MLDTSFGTQGFFRSVEPLAYAPSTRFVQQPDGGLLIVSETTQAQQFSLQLTRLNSAVVCDSTYTPNGEKILNGLPSNFRLASGVLIAAEPNGGFTVVASAISNSDSNYLLIRVTAAGTLDLGFGNGGLVSGYDLGNPFDQPVAMVRTANGGLLLMSNALPNKTILWRVTASGLVDTSLGTTGRLEIDSSNAYASRLAALSDNSIALVNIIYDREATTRVSHFNASGALDSAFGTAGNATISLVGYRAFSAINVLSNNTGGLLIPATAYLTVTCEGVFGQCFIRGMNAVVASLDGKGHLQTSYGRGDGFAVMNNGEYSNDKVDAILVETSDKVVLAGSTDADATLDYLLERLTANGLPDVSFGTNGRVAPRQNNRFMSKVRAAKQENDAITVVSERTIATALRFNSTGTLHAGFTPAIEEPSMSATDIVLGVRPDGRMLYVTTTNAASTFGQVSTTYLRQTMPDGTPDLDFGTGGKIGFSLFLGEYPFHTDLVLLGDGSAVFAVLTNQNLRLYKVDSHGLAVTSFGTDSQFTYTFTEPLSFGEPFSLLSLSDGSLLAGIGINKYAPSSGSSSGSLLVIRISSNGSLIGANNLLADQGYLTWNFSALPDTRVVIARSRSDGTTNSAALYRLLPNNSLDASFGPDGAYPLPAY